MFSKSILAAIAAASVASAQGGGGTPTLTELIGQTDSLSQLGTLLKGFPDLAKTLAATPNITILAPNNAAINEFKSSGMLASASQEEIEAALSYHVLQGIIPSSMISEFPTFAPTSLNSTTYTNVTGGQVVEVLLDDEDVIIYSGLKAQATVVTPDNKYDNGIVHIIDSVLTVPLPVSATVSAAELSAVAGAATAAQLVETIDGIKDITIFAPTNEALAAIGSAATTANQETLTGILDYHVIMGTVLYSTDIRNGLSEASAGAGPELHFTIEGDAVFVNAARIINADILVAGGVMHIIDSVLNPEEVGARPAKPPSDEPAIQFSDVTSASLAPLTSALPPASTTVSALVATTEDVKDYPVSSAAASSSGAAGGGSGGSGGGGGGSSGASGLETAMMGALAVVGMIGGGALFVNW